MACAFTNLSINCHLVAEAGVATEQTQSDERVHEGSKAMGVVQNNVQVNHVHDLITKFK